MTTHNKGLFSLCTALVVLTVVFIGCDNPGSVGSEFVDKPELTFDTLNVDQTEVLNFNGYSGRLGFIPIGYYEDGLFGDMEAVGLLKPQRRAPSTSDTDTVEIEDSFELKLRLRVDSLEVYGDTLSTANFTVHEITSDWRGQVLQLEDDIEYGNQVGQFSLAGGEREAIVDLDQSWVDQYKTWYNDSGTNVDSAYNYQFKGLAIVPEQNSSKISFVRSDRSSFIIINGVNSDTTDTVSVPFRDYGYTLERGGAVNTPNTFPIHTTLEGMLEVSIPVEALREEIQTSNIIRADFVVYAAEEELESSLPANHQRLPLNVINFDLLETLDPVYEYQFGQVDFSGSASEDDASYSINITNFVNNLLYGEEERDQLILGAGSSSGVIRSSLFYGNTAPEEVRPKIIITSLVD